MKKVKSVCLTIIMAIAVSAQADSLKVDAYAGIEEEPNIIGFTGVKSLPYNLSIFGFVDFSTAAEKGNNLKNFYGETNLTLSLYKGWGVIAELNEGSNMDPLFRGGISYRPPLFKNYGLGLKFLPFRSDGKGGQASISFHKDIYEKFFVEGWGDLNIPYENSQDTSYMVEIQGGMQLEGDVYAVVEYRVNDCTPDHHKVGVGLEYRF
ncbi:hypothetical protein JW698_00765 [Candidatus Wolfebacteria bacterium]|nr:hypothetical protein [Candidatus Wolfebacteria bacterium]